MKKKISLITILAAGLFLTETLQAQESDFHIANRLMQQQNYEEALPILQRIHDENPGANIFFNHLIDCLVNLKEYDKASVMIEERFDQGFGTSQLMVKRGNILHTQGDREAASEIWSQVIRENEGNMQYYYLVGNAMMDRREYQQAAELYLSARDTFNDDTLFINEIANAQMRSGNFTRAMGEYFRLVRANPNQINFVQQRLLRMQDDRLFEVAAVEIEDHIMDMDLSHPAYSQLHELYIWLLVESRQFRRAFIAARQYESRTEVLNYSLYSLARNLVSNSEFELAAEAYQHYTELPDPSVSNQAKDRQGQVYQLWANYLSDHNLEELQLREELYRKSYCMGSELLAASPSYERRDRVMIRQAELALDVFHDPEKALGWIERLEADNSGEARANLYYLRGRLNLFNRSYSEARQSFTRANRETDDSDLAEKARYFLSLTDFFSGDFEFALIQLRSLERRNVSYYANNALKLRMWIQEGKRADTSGRALKEYATILEKLYSGDTMDAIDTFQALFEHPTHPFKAHALVQISADSNIRHIPLLYPLLHHFNAGTAHSPLRERLLWEQASKAKMIVEAGGPDELEGFVEPVDDPDGRSSGGPPVWESVLFESQDWPSSFADVEELYEKIILEFPQGFYAPYAREQLQQLTQLSSVK